MRISKRRYISGTRRMRCPTSPRVPLINYVTTNRFIPLTLCFWDFLTVIILPPVAALVMLVPKIARNPISVQFALLVEQINRIPSLVGRMIGGLTCSIMIPKKISAKQSPQRSRMEDLRHP